MSEKINSDGSVLLFGMRKATLELSFYVYLLMLFEGLVCLYHTFAYYELHIR